MNAKNKRLNFLVIKHSYINCGVQKAFDFVDYAISWCCLMTSIIGDGDIRAGGLQPIPRSDKIYRILGPYGEFYPYIKQQSSGKTHTKPP